MELKLDNTIFRALPAYVVEHDGGAMLKRGTLETFVKGEGALDTLQFVLEMARNGVTRDEITAEYSEVERPEIGYLFDQLVERRILVSVDEPVTDEVVLETPESLLHWDINQDQREAHERVRSLNLAIVGVNEISRELTRSLRRGGVERCTVIDYELFRNIRMFRTDGSIDDSQYDVSEWQELRPLSLKEWQARYEEEQRPLNCVIVTSDHGGLHWMRYWNEMCMLNRLTFFPVALQNMIGYIGPLVIPGETACFECLRARQNSNLVNPSEERALEIHAYDTRHVVSFHPCMPATVAQIAAMELFKFFGQALPFRNVGSLIEVNLLTPEIKTRKILRIPNCPVCRSLIGNAPTATAIDDGFLPGN